MGTLRRLCRHYGIPKKIANVIRIAIEERQARLFETVNWPMPSRHKQEFGTAACPHPSCFCWPLTALWEHPQNKSKTIFLWPPRHSWTTLILRTACSCSYTQQQMQEKINVAVAVNSARLNLHINRRKNKVLQINASAAPILCWRARRYKQRTLPTLEAP